MKQPKIHITDVHGKDWGLKNVSQINWDSLGIINSIIIDFLGNYKDLMFMCRDRDGDYVNAQGNLKGKLIFKDDL